jgi:hypothetical protein
MTGTQQLIEDPELMQDKFSRQELISPLKIKLPGIIIIKVLE